MIAEKHAMLRRARRPCAAEASQREPVADRTFWARVLRIILALAAAVWMATVQPGPKSSTASGGDSAQSDLPACPRSLYAFFEVSPFYGEDGLLFLKTLSYGSGNITWRSSDSGQTWQPVLRMTDWYPNAGTYQKLEIPAIRSTEGLNIFTRGGFGYPGGGLAVMLQSVDSGDTWTFLQMCDMSQDYCRNWNDLFYFTNEPGTWFVARYEGFIDLEADILRWSGGQSFSTVWQETGAYRLSISSDYANDHLLYASLAPASPTLNTSFIRSYDGGETWEDGSGDGLCPGETADLRFSPDFASDRTVFAQQFGSLFKSVDGGETWRIVYPSDGAVCQSPGSLDAVREYQLSPHYAADQTLYLTAGASPPNGARLLVSAEGGATWQNVLEIPGTIDDLIVAANPPALEPSLRSSTAASSGRDTARNSLWPTSQTRLFLPLALARGPALRPLTLFVNAGVIATGVYRYTSDDGGLTWRCLGLPPA